MNLDNIDRFKLRAWNKLSNEMKDVISLNINHEFPECSNVVLETNTFDAIKTHQNPINCAVGLKHVELLQCSGLKDKDGTLIYEGDIARFSFGNTNKIGVVSCSYTVWNISNANFVQGAFCGGALINMHKKMKVVGNIFQNKELLDNE